MRLTSVRPSVITLSSGSKRLQLLLQTFPDDEGPECVYVQGMNRNGSRGRARLADVANEAGVSVATVSRCLHRPMQVNARTREAVLGVVDRLGYVPDKSAQNLKTGRSNVIGAVVPTLANSMFARGLQAFQDELAKQSSTLLLASSSYDPQSEFHQIRTLVSQGVRGLLLIGRERDGAVYDFLQGRGVSYVLAWCKPEGDHLTVGFDNRAAARELAGAVAAAGHRRVSMIAGLSTGNDRAAARIAGVRDALAEAGLPPPNVIECPYAFDAAGDAFDRIMGVSDRPTAVMCGNDVQAIGVLMRARSLNLSVPRDVAVTGFDDIDLARIVSPSLTTIHVPHRRMGLLSAQALLDEVPRDTMIETEIVWRETFQEPADRSGRRRSQDGAERTSMR